MIFNYVLIALFLLLFIYFVTHLFKYGDVNSTEEVRAGDFETLEDLDDAVFTDIDEKVSMNKYMVETRISKKDVETLEQNRRYQAEAVRNCTNGSEGTRETTKQLVRNYLAQYFGQGKRADSRLRKLIDFTNPSPRVAFESICYVLGPDDDMGFMRAFDEMTLSSDEISKENIDALYRRHCINLSDMQKQEILTQIVYADTFGLGVIDTPNYQKGIIEEIQMGVSGVPYSNFSHKDKYVNGKERKYSCDSISFMIRGDVLRMPSLSFGNESEFSRVITNLIKCSDGGELTAANPEKQVDTVDGRRVNVIMPPATSSLTGFIRKFDSFKYTDISKMYNNIPDGRFACNVLAMLVMTGRNISISGEMATGKTSLLRVLIALLPAIYAIRSVEIGALELALRKQLPEDRNVVEFRICDFFSVNQCFERIKQSSGNIGVVGEVKTPDVWNLLLDMTKFFTQTFWTTHETTTDRMVEEATNARLKVGYSGDRKAAEKEVSKSIHFDIQMKNMNGLRYVDEINEVIPLNDDADVEKIEGVRDAELIYSAVTSITKQMRTTTYKVVPLIKYDREKKEYIIINDISELAQNGYCDRTGNLYPGIESFKEQSDDHPEKAEPKEASGGGLILSAV